LARRPWNDELRGKKRDGWINRFVGGIKPPGQKVGPQRTGGGGKQEKNIPERSEKTKEKRRLWKSPARGGEVDNLSGENGTRPWVGGCEPRGKNPKKKI